MKSLPAMQETQEMRVQSLGQEDPLEEEMASHSSILAWEIPWTEESDSPWGHKELDTTECMHMRAHTHTHPRLYGPQSLKYLLFVHLQKKFVHLCSREQGQGVLHLCTPEIAIVFSYAKQQ